MPISKFYPLTAAEEIDKAIKFIKARQFHAGFPEITRPHLGGKIDVTIECDPEDENVFHIKFRFITIPGHQTILQEYKRATYHEVRRYASEYDKDKENIDSLLAGAAAKPPSP